MKLIVITPSKDLPDEPSLVARMFESGLQTLHLRKPKHSTKRMSDYIAEIPGHFHNRIVVHSHHRLALKYNLRGIHLGRAHLGSGWKYWLVRTRLRFRFAKCTKSRSYSRLQQAYNKEEQQFDYFLIGTVFNNMTGDLYSGYYENGLLAANRNCGKKLVARGGTTPASVEKAARYGFHGIAFSSFLWDHDRPVEKFGEVIAEFRRLNLEIE